MLRVAVIVLGLFSLAVVGGGTLGDFGVPTLVEPVAADPCVPFCDGEGPDPGGCHPHCDVLGSPCRPICLGVPGVS